MDQLIINVLVKGKVEAGFESWVLEAQAVQGGFQFGQVDGGFIGAGDADGNLGIRQQEFPVREYIGGRIDNQIDIFVSQGLCNTAGTGAEIQCSGYWRALS